MAKDPIDFGGGDTNPYAYGRDPANSIDPTGCSGRRPGCWWNQPSCQCANPDANWQSAERMNRLVRDLLEETRPRARRSIRLGTHDVSLPHTAESLHVASHEMRREFMQRFSNFRILVG
ncbi:MAG: hypothetical protein R3F60_18755 [bacterium]